MTTSTVTLEDLLDLGISGTDVGCVNFNIIRIILGDLIKKMGKIDKSPVTLGEFESNIVSNYRNYMLGEPVSPMPGVVRLAGGTVSKKGALGQSPRPPQAPRPGAPPLPPSAGTQAQGGGGGSQQGQSGGPQGTGQVQQGQPGKTGQPGSQGPGQVQQQGSGQAQQQGPGQAQQQGPGQAQQQGPGQAQQGYGQVQQQGQQSTQAGQPGVPYGTQAGSPNSEAGTQQGLPGQSVGQQAQTQGQQGTQQGQVGASSAKPGQAGVPKVQPGGPKVQPGGPAQQGPGQPGAPQGQTVQAQQGGPQAQSGVSGQPKQGISKGQQAGSTAPAQGTQAAAGQSRAQGQVQGGQPQSTSGGQGAPGSPSDGIRQSPSGHGPSASGSQGERHRTHEIDHGMLKDLQDRINSMEEVVYSPDDPQHPSQRKVAPDPKSKGKDGDMAPADMWQLVNLNNRIAAAEAAIQKMAGLVDNMASKGAISIPSSGDDERKKRRKKEKDADSGNDGSPSPPPGTKSKKAEGGRGGGHHGGADDSTDPIYEPTGATSDALASPSGHHHKKGQRKSQDQGSQAKRGKGSQDAGTMAEGEESLSQVDETYDPTTPEGQKRKSGSERKSGSRGEHHHKESRAQGTGGDESEGGAPRKSHRLSGREEAQGFRRPSQVKNITESQIKLLSPDEQMQVRKLKHQMGEPSVSIDFEHMTPEDIAKIPIEDLIRMTPSQVRGISDAATASMDADQLKALDDILAVEREHYKDISHLTEDEIENIPPEVLATLPAEVQEKMHEIQQDIKYHKPSVFDNLDPAEVATITISTLDRLTPDQVAKISDDVRSHMTPEQLAKLDEIQESGQNYNKRETGDDFFSEASMVSNQDHKAGKRKKPTPKRHRDKKRKGKKDEEGQVDDTPVIPKPRLGEYRQILTMEGYLASLRREDIENMAAGAVKDELRRQYAQLQGLQNKLVKDIHDKMEIVYQRLLREIITQQLTSSPYTILDSAEKCPGPGICKGHGMPAGIAVCQYPDVAGKSKTELLKPDDSACPSCGMGMGNAELKNLKTPIFPKVKQGEMSTTNLTTMVGEKFDYQNQLAKDAAATDDAIKEMRALITLDLDKMRRNIKNTEVGEFDEKDILERLETLWEAVKVIKINEESLAAKIARQETLMKKGPTREGAEPLAFGPHAARQHSYATVPGTVESPTHAVANVSVAKDEGEKDNVVRSNSADKDDIQTLFTNLANVIGECADQKDRIDQLMDTVRIIESGMVTKQMLTDAMSDKADKGQINSKVSYDEFGNTVDELHNQLHNLMVEGYQRNETWKKVTADLAEELAEKLDKVELAPIRAFFKNRLKKLEDRVLILSTILEEPDPAGTRKKMLKNYNCISCDRKVNITGLTNTSTLPQLPAQFVSSSTAARRTFDLCNLRNQRTRQDSEAKEIAELEQTVKRLSQTNRMSGREGQLNEKDLMQAVNRYSGQQDPAGAAGDLPTFRKSLGSQQQNAVRASQDQRKSMEQQARKSLQEQTTRVSDNQLQIMKQESQSQIQEPMMEEEDFEEEYLEYYEEEEDEEPLSMGQEE